ncbi:DNA polymerase III subunit gamma/tau [Flocculibacter collagenilyticus]|uniref:DNA polymerase III subunit gamma/tau n=1 Tax=Flocculibacter collagenilyticus TaxID=2744479 RepID=UPI0018F4B5FC|nr:DNA polymerase III subunit gamma/tau [Flocculibacter collagenilyticus]
MSYQVLARKWRPANFSELVGQDHVKMALTNALEQERLHHAYLFTGTRGVGKTTIARILAKSLNCEKGITATPCGQCNVCSDVERGRFVDLIEIDAASRTKVEDTREILDNVQYAPTQGRYKVYLIDEVHMLSKHSFNALLKTLEEPPQHVKFLLATTDPQKLPITILSRCLQFNLKSLTRSQIAAQLTFILEQENITAQASALQLLAKAAKGSMRDALSLTDQAIAQSNASLTDDQVHQMLGTLDVSWAVKLLQAIFEQQVAQLFQYKSDMELLAPDYESILDDILNLLHLIALTQVLPSAAELEEEYEAFVKHAADTVTAEDIQLYYQIVLNGKRDLPFSADNKAGFEMVMLRILSFKPVSGARQQAQAATVQTTHQAGGQSTNYSEKSAPEISVPPVSEASVAETSAVEASVTVQHTASDQDESSQNLAQQQAEIMQQAESMKGHSLDNDLLGSDSLGNDSLEKDSFSSNPTDANLLPEQEAHSAVSAQPAPLTANTIEHSDPLAAILATRTNSNERAFTQADSEKKLSKPPEATNNAEAAPQATVTNYQQTDESPYSTLEQAQQQSPVQTAEVANASSIQHSVEQPFGQPSRSAGIEQIDNANLTGVSPSDENNTAVEKSADENSSELEAQTTPVAPPEAPQLIALSEQGYTDQVRIASQVDQWANLVDRTGVTGRVRQIALHSVCEQIDDTFKLTLANEQSHLVTENSYNQLLAALQNTLQQNVILQIENTQELLKTPYNIQIEIDQYRLRRAKEIIFSDPVVQFMQQEFDAQVNEDSIRPLN